MADLWLIVALCCVVSLGMDVLSAIALGVFQEWRKKKVAINAKLRHATEFSTIEQQFLTLWNKLQDAGQGALADDLLFAGLQSEHFNSTLDPDPAKRSDEEAQILQQLNAVFQGFVAKANAALAGVVISEE